MENLVQSALLMSMNFRLVDFLAALYALTYSASVRCTKILVDLAVSLNGEIAWGVADASQKRLSIPSAVRGCTAQRAFKNTMSKSRVDGKMFDMKSFIFLRNMDQN